MKHQLLVVVSLVGVLGFTPIVTAQQGGTDSQRPKGVPEQYAGNWVCQTYLPGYNLTRPHADPSQPLTNNSTTPSTVQVLKFSLGTDGVYQVSNAKGHYSFDSVTKAITWLDGAHQKSMTKTEIGKRDNGAPKIGFMLNKRYYGCYLSKPRTK